MGSCTKVRERLREREKERKRQRETEKVRDREREREKAASAVSEVPEQRDASAHTLAWKGYRFSHCAAYNGPLLSSADSGDR